MDMDMLNNAERIRDLCDAHARAIAAAGTVDAALAQGLLPPRIDTTLAEALVLGLLRQGVQTFLSVLGHGSTEVGEVLRIYESAGLLRSYGLRSEIEASHAAMALRWAAGEKAAVVTSIGPGAMQAMAASLAPASDGVGVWYLFGDETSEDEGPNMQQVPKHEQQVFLRVCSAMGEAYSLHTAGALGTALRRGLAATDHPYRAGPFFVLMPLNTQPQEMPGFNLAELPCGPIPRLGAAAGEDMLERAAESLLAAKRVVVKVGRGGLHCGEALERLLELCDGVAVLSPGSTGALAFEHPRNMLVGGSKGSSCGNSAMEQADLLLALGTRFVCQSDCSRSGYPRVEQVININADLRSAMHYNDSIVLVGDCEATLHELNARLSTAVVAATATVTPDIRAAAAGAATAGTAQSAVAAATTTGAAAERAAADATVTGSAAERTSAGATVAGTAAGITGPAGVSPWAIACKARRDEWLAFAHARYRTEKIFDKRWGRELLTQPAVIKAATDWARANDVPVFFDAGDVQANGFQIVEDDRPGRCFTESGASYMGFAASALLATGIAREPFYALALIGDGSFTMNPQVLIDGAAHGARGCILLLDNRRMGAISGLQKAQYGYEHATCDEVEVDYLGWARSVAGVEAFDAGNDITRLLQALARIIHETSATSLNRPQSRPVLAFRPSTYC